MVQGKDEARIIKQCLRENKPFPKAIQNAPDLEIENQLYYFAFQDLGSCRYFEQGEIPWTAIKSYCDEYGLDGDRRVFMFDVIRKVDVWFLNKIEERASKRVSRGKTINQSSGSSKSGKKALPVGGRG